MEGAVTGGAFESPNEGAVSTGGLRPLGVGEVLDRAIKLYRRNAVPLWKIVACIVVPASIINQIIVGVSLPSEAFVHNGLLYTPTGEINTPAGGVVAGIVISVLAGLLANGAMSISLVDAYVEQPLDWVASIRAAGSRFASLVWLAIIWVVIVGIGFIALVLPGIWLVVVWSVSIPALMFEQLGGFKALGRSFDLVRGRWWATFAELLVSLIMLAIISFVVSFLISELAKGLKVDSIGLWLGFNWVARVITDLLVFPFLFAVIAVIYIDLRVRKEALDIELLANQFRSSAPSAPAAATPAGPPPPSEPSPPSPPTWPPAG